MFSRANEEVDGVGIGLAVCRRIIEAHGGRIWVEPADGGGSAFRFTLPADRPPRYESSARGDAEGYDYQHERDVRHRRRRAGRRQGRRDAARGGLRRPHRARRRRARPPYERPPLSKDYLRGEAERDDGLRPRRGLLRRARHRAAHVGTTSTALDPRRAEVDARRRRAARLRRLLLATGAEPRRLAAARAPTSTASTTCARSRTPTRCASALDARRPRGRGRRGLDRLRGRRLGAPATGCEVTVDRARRCRSSGCSGREIGEHLPGPPPRPRRRAALGDRRRALRGRRRASSASAPTGGRTIECDLVVVGVGVAAAHRAGRGAGLAVDNGILVDAAPARPARPGSSPPATSPTPGTRSTSGASASSTGPTRSTRARPRPAPCSASRRLRPDPVLLLRPVRRRHGVLGLRRRWDEVVFRGDSTRASSSRSGCRTAGSSAGMNVNVWDVNDADPGADPRRAQVDPAACATRRSTGLARRPRS